MNLLRIQKIINKKSYENKIYVLRRYPLVFVRFIFFFILLAVLPYALYYVFDYMYPLLFSGPVAKPLLILCSSAYYLAIWVFFLSSFVDYYLDIWIVTNDRIINIEQLGLFARSISELDLYQIQDVTSEIKGIFPTLATCLFKLPAKCPISILNKCAIRIQFEKQFWIWLMKIESII